MKKIMFNDRYDLTIKVLRKEKIQTRRELNPTMLWERIDTGFDGWSREDIKAWEQSCYERLYKADGDDLKAMLDYALKHSPYKIGEEVAIAQSYSSIIALLASTTTPHSHDWMRKEAGWDNKMFVKANIMPHRIRITDVRLERLQDISTEDCLQEGVEDDFADGSLLYWFSVDHNYHDDWREINDELARHEWDGKKGCWFWDTAQGAYHALINCLDGKMWERNPYVFAYTFELIK